MLGVAAADGQVQIEMGMICQTSAVVRDNEGLASTNPYRGCPGITASHHQACAMTNCYLTIHTRYTTSLGLNLRVAHCMERPDKTEASDEPPLLSEGG